MAFMLKDFRSIVASMVNVMRSSQRKITDFNVGSVARTLVEAPAIELDQLYQEMFHGLKEAIPVATYNSFNFEKLPAAPATGVLTFYATGGHTEAILVPSGTLAKNETTNKLYQTTRDLLIPVGATQGSVSGVATEAGLSTNCGANAILVIIGSIAGVSGVSNITPFTGGRDLESDEERKLRFGAYITTLNRGTLAAVNYGAGTAEVRDENDLVVERVAFISIIEPYEDDPVANLPGFLQVYVHNGTGGTTPALVTEVQKVIDGYYDADGVPVPGWKAAGVVVSCFAAGEVVLPVTAVLTLLPGFQSAAVLSEATTAVRSYLLGLSCGKQAILNEIIERIMAVPGVYNVAVSAPTADTSVLRSQKIMPGVIALTAA